MKTLKTSPFGTTPSIKTEPFCSKQFGTSRTVPPCWNGCQCPWRQSILFRPRGSNSRLSARTCQLRKLWNTFRKNDGDLWRVARVCEEPRHRRSAAVNRWRRGTGAREPEWAADKQVQSNDYDEGAALVLRP